NSGIWFRKPISLLFLLLNNSWYSIMIALATSNTLKLTNGEYTGVVKYRGNTDQYGYNWTDSSPDFYIQNRIPADLQNQAFPVTESVYRQSNGYYRRAKTFVEKTKELHTDWETDQFHEGLVLALKHDQF